MAACQIRIPFAFFFFFDFLIRSSSCQISRGFEFRSYYVSTSKLLNTSSLYFHKIPDNNTIITLFSSDTLFFCISTFGGNSPNRRQKSIVFSVTGHLIVVRTSITKIIIILLKTIQLTMKLLERGHWKFTLLKIFLKYQPVSESRGY